MTIRTVLISGWLLLSGSVFAQTTNAIKKRGHFFKEAHVLNGLGKRTNIFLKGQQHNRLAQLGLKSVILIKNDLSSIAYDRISAQASRAFSLKINPGREINPLNKIITAFLLLLLLGLSYRAYRSRIFTLRQSQAQRLEIEQQTELIGRLSDHNNSLLNEKEWLMKEIPHRVKNNLQIVISLLSKQSQYADNEIAYNAIRDSQNRMESISLIHQKLYQSENLAQVDIRSYIGELVSYLRESFAVAACLTFEIDVDPIVLYVTRAIPMGLIFNEVITNSIKYGFPEGGAGKICIGLKHSDNNILALTVHDNGVGAPVKADNENGKALGMSLMQGLSKQLSGSFNIKNKNGMTITVHFAHDYLLQAV